MNRRVELKRLSTDTIESPLLWENPNLQPYEGFHYIDEVCLNVGRIFVAVDPETQTFAVAEEGSPLLHGWYKIDVNPQASFYDWCFFPRELTKV